MSRKFLTSIDLLQNELQNARLQNLASAPSTPVTGQIYYNTTSNKTFYWNGTSWVDISSGTTYSAGTGLTLTTGTFAIDPAYASFTNYYTKTQIDAGYQPLDGDLTAIAALAGTSGLLKKTGTNTWTLDTATYLTANQTITLSGEATGSGTTAITITLTNSAVIGKVLTGYASGANTPLAATDTILAAFGKVQGQLDAKLSAEADTLATVTGRGATTGTAVSITNATASSSSSNGALVVTGGVGIGGNANVGGNLAVTGNLTINGTTTTVNSTVTTIDDPVITLGGDTAPAADDNKDRGVEFRWHNGTVAKVGFFGFDDSTGKFTFIPDATNTSEVFSGTKGIIDATILGSDVSGAVALANALTTPRSITQTGDVSWTVNFDGSANASAAATISAATVTGKVLTGLTIPAASDIVAGDTILQALGKLQAQIDAADTLVAGKTSKYAVAITGGATSEVITHNLNTRDVVVNVARAATPWDTVECDVERTTVNTITLRFSVAPAAGEYRVSVVG